MSFDPVQLVPFMVILLALGFGFWKLSSKKSSTVTPVVPAPKPVVEDPQASMHAANTLSTAHQALKTASDVLSDPKADQNAKNTATDVLKAASDAAKASSRASEHVKPAGK